MNSSTELTVRRLVSVLVFEDEAHVDPLAGALFGGGLPVAEVQAALKLGLPPKLFPFESSGGTTTAIRDVAFIPTCGVSLENLDNYLASDVVAKVWQ